MSAKARVENCTETKKVFSVHCTKTHSSLDTCNRSRDAIWLWKQGWIHGYPSRVRVSKGCIWGHLIIWVGAVRPNSAKTLKKRTDWQTDGLTKRGVALHGPCYVRQIRQHWFSMTQLNSKSFMNTPESNPERRGKNELKIRRIITTLRRLSENTTCS